VTDTVGYAVIGAGLVGPTHARFAAKARGAQLRVVRDLRADRGERLAEELGAQWVADYRDCSGGSGEGCARRKADRADRRPRNATD
jgi:ornithine cyclodeaminase/alanine dehydrogenase-like protein (mu-crystallin family)